MVHKRCYQRILFFFFNDTPTPEIYPLPLHDALPISAEQSPAAPPGTGDPMRHEGSPAMTRARRKSRRALNELRCAPAMTPVSIGTGRAGAQRSSFKIGRAHG